MKHGNIKGGKLPIFRDRLRLLQGDMSVTSFAEKLGLTRQTVGFYLNGDRIPDALTLMEIAQKCDVSSDYLLGMSELKSSSASIKECVNLTGLTEDQLLYLSAWSRLIELEEKQSLHTLSEIELNVLNASKKIGSPRFARHLCINFLRNVVYAVLKRPEAILNEFSTYRLSVEDSQKFKWGKGPKNLTREQFEDLAESGYTVVPSSVSARISWELISSILDQGIKEVIITQYDKREAQNGTHREEHP